MSYYGRSLSTDSIYGDSRQSSPRLALGGRHLALPPDQRGWPCRPAPYGLCVRDWPLPSWPIGREYIDDPPFEEWPKGLRYGTVYKRKWLGFTQLHKYYFAPYPWERGSTRYGISYPPAGWNCFNRHRYVINPPLVRVP